MPIMGQAAGKDDAVQPASVRGRSQETSEHEVVTEVADTVDMMAQVDAERTGHGRRTGQDDAPPAGVVSRFVRACAESGMEAGGKSAKMINPTMIAMLAAATRRNQFSHTTAFLRNRPQLEELAGALLPRLRPAGGELSALVVGGSTGAEALSLLVSLQEFGPEVGSGGRLDARVLSLDVSEAIMSVGRSGRYAEEEFLPLFGREGGLPPEVKARWFQPDGEGVWRARPELATRVEFQTLDLLTENLDAAPGGFDLVVCQNVLTHLIPPVAARLLDRVLVQASPQAAVVCSGVDLDLKQRILDRGFRPWTGRLAEIHEAFWSHRMHYRENRGQHYFELENLDHTRADFAGRYATLFLRD